MKSISITLNYLEKKNVKQKLSKYRVECLNEHIEELYKYKKYTISLYKTGSFLIQGDDAQLAYQWIFNRSYAEIDLDKQNIWNEITPEIDQNEIATIGSDEVGVGDFFGGLIVCAVCVNPQQVSLLKKMGVTDSKKLNDEMILKIYPQLIKLVEYDSQTLTPTAYNEIFSKYRNAHILKAVLHNQALSTLHNKCASPHRLIIDQFASSSNYYKYLEIAQQKPVKIDLFITQAEQKYIAVACASIIARAIFLQQINALEQPLSLTLPLGASNPYIKILARKILKTFGIETFNSLVKMHFKTYTEIVDVTKDWNDAKNSNK